MTRLDKVRVVGGPMDGESWDISTGLVQVPVSRPAMCSFSLDDPIPPPIGEEPDPYGEHGQALYRLAFKNSEPSHYWFLRIDWNTPLPGYEGAERGW